MESESIGEWYSLNLNVTTLHLHQQNLQPSINRIEEINTEPINI